MFKRFWTAALLLAAAGCATHGEQIINAEAPNVPEPQVEDAYYLEPGDVFELKFFNNPQLNETVAVRPDGRVSVQLVEDLLVAGKTPAEVDALVTEAYAKKLRAPEIAIIMREFSGAKVFVGGEVLAPRLVDLKGPLTVTRAIFHAGGQRESASLRSVIVVRHHPGQKPVVMNVNVSDVLGGDEPDVLLRPYDIVYVPKSYIAEAGKFVDQYANQIVPRWVSVPFGFNYFVNSSFDEEKARGTTVVEPVP